MTLSSSRGLCTTMACGINLFQSARPATSPARERAKDWVNFIGNQAKSEAVYLDVFSSLQSVHNRRQRWAFSAPLSTISLKHTVSLQTDGLHGFLSGGLLSGGWLVSVISDFDVHSVVLPADAKNTARTSSVPGLSAVRFGAMRFSGFLEKITRASTLRPQTEQFHLIGSTIMHNRRPFLLISRRLNLGLSLRRNHLKLLLSRET